MSVDAKERMGPMELGGNVKTSTSEIDRAIGSEVARGRGWRGKGLGRAGERSGTEQRSEKTERLRGGQRQQSVLPAAASTKVVVFWRCHALDKPLTGADLLDL